MTAYFTGDIPAKDLVIEPARGGVAVDLAPFDTVETVFRAPDGSVIESSGFLADIDGETIVVEWPSETVLEEPGVYQLTPILEGTGDVRETLAPVRIVVEEEGSAWYTLELARLDWQEAPDPTDFGGAGDYVLWELLEAAKEEVIAFAPTLDEDVRPPLRYRKGQLMHARTLWNAGNSDTNGQVGLEGFVVTPKSLEKDTREVLRPRTGRPAVG
jgi:hypothetical protein